MFDSEANANAEPMHSLSGQVAVEPSIIACVPCFGVVNSGQADRGQAEAESPQRATLKVNPSQSQCQCQCQCQTFAEPDALVCSQTMLESNVPLPCLPCYSMVLTAGVRRPASLFRSGV